MKLWFCAVLGVLLVTSLVAAEIPEIVGYQGRITDNVGNPVADGTYTMRFQIYDQLIGGTVLWDSGNISVPLSGGVFNVNLGGTGQPALDLAFDQNYYLLVTFDGENQTPRRPLASVGYAYMASGLVPGTEVTGSVETSPFAAIKGTNTATQYATYGLLGESASTSGRGVKGLASSPTGSTYGLFGGAASTAGHGVYGIADATEGSTYGVRGLVLSSGGIAVLGEALASSGTTYGVYGHNESTSGIGVYGVGDALSGQNRGVKGETNSSMGVGVYGYATAAEGTTRGVLGTASSTSGTGVHGVAQAATGTTYGVYGYCLSPSGTGVYGGAVATTGGAYGVHGESAASLGRGVVGKATAETGSSYGVYGRSESADGCGVYGFSPAGTGVYGCTASASSWDMAVYGHASHINGTAVGVLGSSNSGLGYGVYSSGDFAASGSKSCVIITSQGPTRLYCQESPECWFEDFGEGQLVDGRAEIALDALFLETVTIDEDNPMHVFLQPYDEGCVGVLVERDDARFHVINPSDPRATGRFSYRVVAKRRGFEQKRLEYCETGEADPYLYPELRGEQHGRIEREQVRLERRDIEARKHQEESIISRN